MTEKEKPLKPKDPVERLAALRHEFGEHGGVNMSIEASTTFTVMEAGTMPEIFKDGSVQTLVVVFYTADTSTQPFTYLVVRLPRWMARKQAASGLGLSPALCLAYSRKETMSSPPIPSMEGAGRCLPNSCPKMRHHGNIRRHRRPGSCRCCLHRPHQGSVYRVGLEPTLRVSDLPQLANIAHEKNAKLVVDNTFTPLAITPIENGADVVVHSPQFVNGASDHCRCRLWHGRIHFVLNGLT